MKNKIHTIYKITNNINGKCYVGAHSTYNINDGYMGSGNLIKSAIKKYGKENFTKEILFEFDNKKEMLEKEKEIVCENFVKNENTYNIREGGSGAFDMIGTFIAVDENNKKYRITKDDPRYLSGELVSANKGQVTVKNSFGKCFNVSVNDPRYLSGELVSINKGKVTVKDELGNIFDVKITDERYTSGKLKPAIYGKYVLKNTKGEKIIANIQDDDPRKKDPSLVGFNKGKIVVRTPSGNNISVSVNDPKYLSGEYKSVCDGCSNDMVIAKDTSNTTIRVHKSDERLKTGELVGITKGLALVKDKNGNVFQVDKSDERLKTGELVGITKGRKWMHKEEKATTVLKEEIDKYKKMGWSFGKRRVINE